MSVFETRGTWVVVVVERGRSRGWRTTDPTLGVLLLEQGWSPGGVYDDREEGNVRNGGPGGFICVVCTHTYVQRSHPPSPFPPWWDGRRRFIETEVLDRVFAKSFPVGTGSTDEYDMTLGQDTRLCLHFR